MPQEAPAGVELVGENEVLACDAVFLTVAISALDAVLARIGDRLAEGTVAFDTCSVKMRPIESMLRYLPPGVSIIGTHPMFGPDSGRDGVAGLPIVYCPVRAEAAVAEEWRHTFHSMGLNVRELTPQEHDREAAYTQGVTHFVGRVLEAMKLQPSEIATVGYRKLLEIIEQTCNDPWQLFLDLQRFNPYTSEMRNRLSESLKRIVEEVEKSPDLTPH
jgi:prephenate dehydrogenase